MILGDRAIFTSQYETGRLARLVSTLLRREYRILFEPSNQIIIKGLLSGLPIIPM